jgi:intracellular septation protein
MECATPARFQYHRGEPDYFPDGNMHPIFDFLPVVAFFIAYWLKDFQTAVLVIIVAITVQVILTRLVTGTVGKMLLTSAGLVIGLGGLSLLLKNDLIFKWKPTVLNWLFGVAFLASQYVGNKTIIQRILQNSGKQEIILSPEHWRQLNLMWVIFFSLAGIANIIVAYNFSEAVWVNFKLFGLLGLTIAFIVFQAFWLNSRTETQPADQIDFRE